MSVKHIVFVAVALLLQACGGGGGGGGSTDPVASSQASLSSSSVSSISSSSSSKSSSSMPADYPVGTADSLPVLNLKTDNSAPIISKVDYLKGSFSLKDTDGTTVDGTLEVRGRGNSTWDWPKKPYRLKLTNSTALLAMPAGKNWVLLANYADKTMVRNDVAFMFSRNLGMEYTPRSQYVELNLNGAYQGVYQLVEHIRIDKSRVNIPEMKVTDTDADKITGGYLLEVDFRHNKNYCSTSSGDPVCKNGVNTSRDVDFCIDSTHGMDPVCLSNPDTLHDVAWSAQRDYIVKYYNDFEAALFGSNFTDPNVGYAAYVDVDSVVNYYLANEVLKNVDGTASSFFIYKKRGGKFFFGPIWDFDLSMGNAGYNDVDKSYGWHIRKAAWYDRFFQDPAFVAKVKERWTKLKSEGKIEYLAQYAEARGAWLDKQQKANYQIWSVTDFAGWIMHVPRGSYSAEVTEMVRWQRERNAWIDSQLQ
ncbi:CotH kinase family protein [Cellvibrio sp.]|uniref:CotH kinase family protein n=1 Tax=Cellvibrio sp. TaxID=1965322 RepID=UPI00396479AF